ncbi:hypothetical protein AMAG_17046 [Allomyces macrogynus ATCC 38327]|uniref:Uncharacterized protein n=1 Tax=Allomyces macrogynus (strain ATCC 38327) TaxID=578462 RepID=A0A0L0TCL7_ALLM3|nr:hypothetical protein AMAG_17046 [Allomyces macrogynus ATCC 38327]|eukprot:KNE72603.1 hypothetical protein AMAG_17046 [Allomyces macrogynus ATCC 38327]
MPVATLQEQGDLATASRTTPVRNPASLPGLPTELLDLITAQLLRYLHGQEACPGPGPLFQLAGTCRSIRATALRHLVASFAVAAVDVIDWRFRGGERTVNIHVAIGKRGCTLCSKGGRIDPICAVQVVSNVVDHGTLTVQSERALRVPRLWLTTLQVGEVVGSGVFPRWLGLATCQADTLIDVLPDLERIIFRSSMVSGKDQAVLMAAKERLVSLALDCSSRMTWLADLVFPRLHSLTLHCIGDHSNIAALPAAPALCELRIGGSGRILTHDAAMYRRYLSYLSSVTVLDQEWDCSFYGDLDAWTAHPTSASMGIADAFAQALRAIEAEFPFRGARLQTIKFAALGAVFPALITAESTPLFYSLLARTTLPALWTARVVMNQSFTSPERDLTLPMLPVLHNLEIMAVQHRGFTDPPCPTVLSTAPWSTTLPRLKRFVCDTNDVTLLALAHPGLHDVRLAAAVWNQLDPGTVHLPSVTRFALTNDDEQNPVKSLSALTGIPRVSHLDLDLHYLTLPVAAALSQIEIANVSCPRDLALVPDPATEMPSTLRLLYISTNAQTWSIVCATHVAPGIPWPTHVVVDMSASVVVADRDVKRIGLLMAWLRSEYWPSAVQPVRLEIRVGGSLESVKRIREIMQLLVFTSMVELVVVPAQEAT